MIFINQPTWFYNIEKDEKESNSSLVTDEFGNMAYITCGDEFKERFVVQSPFPTPSSWSQSVILPSTRKVVTATEGGKGWYLVDTEVEGHILRHVSTFQSPTAISAVNSSTLILSEYNQVRLSINSHQNQDHSYHYLHHHHHPHHYYKS